MARLTPQQRFGANLREARERAELSQSALGRITEYSYSEISRLEGGAREPRLTTLLRLSKALSVEPADLLRDVKASPSRKPSGSGGKG
jgi:transcriptional regulator with XRE-family HTH domain